MTAEPAPTWLQLAACRDVDTRWFFPEPGDAFAHRVALRLCARCPVRVECLVEALAVEDNEQRFGIRGGLTAGERRALSSVTDRADAATAGR